MNERISPLLTDFYQPSMAYSYWASGRKGDVAVFDLFYRQPPFGGEFAIYAGLRRVLEFVNDYHFTPDEISYLRSLPVTKHWKSEFFDYLANLDCSQVKIYAPSEGTLMFPKVPLLIVEGPIIVCQLLETTLLNLTNFASLVTTNAARFRMAAGDDATCLEFGLRRAQGPDGGMSASQYSIMGGFNATSNVLAGKVYGAIVSGTHAHSWVQSFTENHLDTEYLVANTFTQQQKADLTNVALFYLKELQTHVLAGQTNKGELAAFIAYAAANPEKFLALIDTYDVLNSGLPNFVAVAMALAALGYRPVGVRIDSGDLAYLSLKVREYFCKVEEVFNRVACGFGRLLIVASNDINEDILWSLRLKQKHSIDVFGIGTHLVTCQSQPAFGAVYKLVSINGQPVIKLSQDSGKVTFPGKKFAFRFYVQDQAFLDLLIGESESEGELFAAISQGQLPKKVFCRHPFVETKRCFISPSRIQPLHRLVWDGQLKTEILKRPSGLYLQDVAENVRHQLKNEFREDHLRRENPTPYKVSVTQALYDYLHGLMASEAPIPVIS